MTEDHVNLHYVWEEPVEKTLRLLEGFCNDHVVAFNLVFDWFHVNKLYNLLSVLPHKQKPPKIEEVAAAKSITYCLKPAKATDLFLYARRGPYQTLMARRDIKIKRVPTEIAELLARELEKRLDFPNIYFARKQDGYKWCVEYIQGSTFADVVLRFAATSALKPLVQEIFKIPVYDYPIPSILYPEEDEYNPYDTRWQAVIKQHMAWWHTTKAIEYAINDVLYLKRLYEYWHIKDSDIDSELAAQVGACRWRGYAVDHNKIDELIKKAHKVPLPCNINSSREVRRYISNVMQPLEKAALVDSSKKTLESISEWKTEAAIRAKNVLNARRAARRLDNLYKLKICGRFCPNFKIIGTKSGRMSGGSDESVGISINPQGIQHDKEFRSLFTFADEGFSLSGGDFESFEVVLADAVYNDRNLRKDLEAGKKIHAVFGTFLFDESYDTILASKGSEEDYYSTAKQGFLGTLYGARPNRLADVTGLPLEDAEHSYKRFVERYPRIGVSREIINRAFCSMSQPGGLGTEVVWSEPSEYIESLLGFRRYFTLENRIVKTIFELARNLPIKKTGKCKRRDKEQTFVGATQSALYATAFNIQAQNMRAACNHVIQSTGAYITKQVQLNIWNLQPSGVHEWYVQPMNIHDEVMVVHKPILTDTIHQIVLETVESFKDKVPLLSIKWSTDMENWSD